MIKNLPLKIDTEWFVSRNYKTIYVPIPKAASTSIKKYLTVEANSEKIYTDTQDDKFWYQHFQDYFSFSFVRHPIHRLFSCYKNKILQPNIIDKNTGVGIILSKYNSLFHREMTFKDFLEAIITIDPEKYDTHFAPQYTFLYDHNQELVVDYIGKFENVKNDFSYIINKNNLPKVELEVLNKTNYGELYDERSIDLAKSVYGVKEDMEIFNYD